MEKSYKSNQSIHKIFCIIEKLSTASEPMRLTDLASQVKMPLATVLRLINTLIDCGYAYQEKEGSMRYGLTLKFLQIGTMISEHYDFKNQAHPYLLALSRECGETCCLSIYDNNMVRYLDVVETHDSNILIRQRIGGTAYMHATSSGKVLLSNFTKEEIKSIIDDTGLISLTPRTIVESEQLISAVNETRIKGYALDDEECEMGMRCIAVPIIVSGKAICALCLSGPVFRMTDQHIEMDLLPRLFNCANNISRQIGGCM